ncbi:MAG: matrixin family metalloprotease, partial [Candidatus Andersenbacteria bacterium]|nr:matrixin family metalloprotease [Candidatus Andersenbacteria bacterium]
MFRNKKEAGSSKPEANNKQEKIRSAFKFIVLSLFLLPFIASQAYGFAFLGFVSPSNAYRFTNPSNIPYRISSFFLDGSASSMQAVRNAVVTWDNGNTALNFSEVSSSELVYVYSENQGGSGTLAYAQPVISGKTIYYDYVNFNSYYSWSTNPTTGQYDIERVALHEFGHVIGLSHPDQADDYAANYDCSLHPVNATGQEVMNSTGSTGSQSHSLTQDEVCGRDYLYDAVAPAAVTDLSGSKLSSTSIDMYWTAPGDDGTSGTASSYDIRQSTSAIDASNFSSANQLSGVPAPASAGTVQHFTVSGLDGSTTYYFAMKTKDEFGNVSEMSNVMTMGPLNRAPIASGVATPSSPNETEMVQLDASGSSDPDGDTLTYQWRQVSGAISVTLVNATSAVASFSAPEVSKDEELIFELSVSDGTLSSQATIAVTVKQVNKAPVLEAIGTQGTEEAATLSIQVSGSDADGDTLVYSASDLPEGASFDTQTKIFSWTPDYSQSGNYPVTFTVSDGFLTDSETVTITVA